MPTETETAIEEKISEVIDVQPPSMYKVILHNDETTTMEFVVAVLTQIFHREMEEAMSITAEIHKAGSGVAGAPYTKEIAEEKTRETILCARANSFPLVATFEPV
jgi:ATP-dependent Clp protease adaptor protein ClpS